MQNIYNTPLKKKREKRKRIEWEEMKSKLGKQTFENRVREK